jgi:hypothetical protein
VPLAPVVSIETRGGSQSRNQHIGVDDDPHHGLDPNVRLRIISLT